MGGRGADIPHRAARHAQRAAEVGAADAGRRRDAERAGDPAVHLGPGRLIAPFNCSGVVQQRKGQDMSRFAILFTLATSIALLGLVSAKAQTGPSTGPSTFKA